MSKRLTLAKQLAKQLATRQLCRLAAAMVLSCAGPAVPAFAGVDVNTATEAALTDVRGIGPAMARRIVEARAQGGAFRDADDLVDRVAGVGPKSAANLQAAGLTFGKTGAAPPGKGAARSEGRSDGRSEGRGGTSAAGKR
ncbi:ComEA family DNA-binding protein [Cupriavidus sp. OTU4054]